MTCLIPLEELEDSEALDPDRMMLLARKESEKSTMSFKLGAVITKKKRILGLGYNTRKTHTKLGSGKFNMLHAEGSAIYSALNRGYDLEGSVMYIYRRNNNLACPCGDCQAIIKEHKIKKVIYS